MRIGIAILPEHRWWAAEPLWRMAEEYGFDHAWTYDHLGWHTLVDKPWFGAVPTLTAAATVTSTIQLGTLGTSPDFRHPVSLARELTALDDMTDGRCTLGVAPGGTGFDTTVLDKPELSDARKADRFHEFVELLDQILTHDNTTWTGEYYSVVEARRAPGCVRTPRLPFVVAADEPDSMRLAARFGQGWLTSGVREEDTDSWWHRVSELSDQFTEILAGQKRDPARVPRYLETDSASPIYALSSVECFRDTLGRAAELGFTDVITHWPRAEGPYEGSEAMLEEIADDVMPALQD